MTLTVMELGIVWQIETIRKDIKELEAYYAELRKAKAIEDSGKVAEAVYKAQREMGYEGPPPLIGSVEGARDGAYTEAEDEALRDAVEERRKTIFPLSADAGEKTGKRQRLLELLGGRGD